MPNPNHKALPSNLSPLSNMKLNSNCTLQRLQRWDFDFTQFSDAGDVTKITRGERTRRLWGMVPDFRREDRTKEDETKIKCQTRTNS